MKILYHMPSLSTITAGRTIYYGYKHAFEDLKHNFKTLSANEDSSQVLRDFKPDIFITALNPFNLKYLNLKMIQQLRLKGMRVFVSIPLWNSPISRLRISETPSLSGNKSYIKLITSHSFGDVYYNVCVTGDKRMEGFRKNTGYEHISIPLAADKTILFPDYAQQYKADISYIGTNLPGKRQLFRKLVFPLADKYNLKLYGQDWTISDRILNNFQKFGQYFNIPILNTLIKPKLQLEDERRIYTSSKISINIHEDYQRYFGGDCNERTFKIPLCGGFEITDDVACIRKYFIADKEIVIAKDKNDWFDKISYYINHPEKRLSIIESGKIRVKKEHTYHNRVEQILKIYSKIK